MPIKPICSNSISNFERFPCGTFSPPKSNINLWLNRSLAIIYYKSKPKLTRISTAKLLLTYICTLITKIFRLFKIKNLTQIPKTKPIQSKYPWWYLSPKRLVVYKRDEMIAYGIFFLPRTKHLTHIPIYKSNYIYHRQVPKTNLIQI